MHATGGQREQVPWRRCCGHTPIEAPAQTQWLNTEWMPKQAMQHGRDARLCLQWRMARSMSFAKFTAEAAVVVKEH